MAFHILSSNFSFSLLWRSWSTGKGSRRFMALNLDKLNLAPRPMSLAPRPSGDNNSLVSLKLSIKGSTLPAPPPPLARPLILSMAEARALLLVKRPLASRSRRGGLPSLSLPVSLSLVGLGARRVKRPFASRSRVVSRRLVSSVTIGGVLVGGWPPFTMGGRLFWRGFALLARGAWLMVRGLTGGAWRPWSVGACRR